jgi:Mor family transcriptional regulator
MFSSDKRKHKVLTSSAKVEIIKKFNKGEKLINLAKQYGVGRATIYDIRNREICSDFFQ